MLSLAGVALSGGIWTYNTPCPHSSTMGNSNPLARLCNPKLARQITILVADFEGEELDNYRVTDTILKSLKLATAEYSDVRVKALGKTITEEDGSETARKAGKKQNAAIILWGWYDKTETTVPLSVNFEVLAKPEDFPALGEEARGKVRTVTRDELENFTIQTQLSNEMSYLTLVTLGLSRYAFKDWQGVITRLTNALEEVTTEVASLNSSAVRLYRGNAYAQLKEYDKSFADYTRALELDPKFARVYSARCFSFFKLEEYEKALADCNRALEIDSDLALAYNNRGIVYAEEEENEKAIADYTRALEIDSDLALAYNNRGNAYNNLQDHNRAISDFNRALEVNPNLVIAYGNRGLAYLYKKDYKTALTDFNHALKIYPKDAWTYNHRGTAYLYKKEYEKAIIDYSHALEINPNYASAYYNRGIAYRFLQKYEKAIDDYSRALEIVPKDAWAYKNRGNVYSHLQKYEKAIDDYSRVLEIVPEDAYAYKNRGKAYSFLGNTENAKIDFQKALELTNDRELRQEIEQQLQQLQ